MTLWEHLEELRSRLVKMALAFAVGAIASWNFPAEILEILTQPFVAAWKLENGASPRFTSSHPPRPSSPS